jgi:hypothetical protein
VAQKSIKKSNKDFFSCSIFNICFGVCWCLNEAEKKAALKILKFLTFKFVVWKQKKIELEILIVSMSAHAHDHRSPPGRIAFV